MYRNRTILVAEDSDAEVTLLEHAFSRVGINASIHFVRDGQEAIEYLQGDGSYHDRQIYKLPDLLLLDLKMPRLGGFDVLAWLQERSDCDCLVVVVLTSSDDPKDVTRAYQLHANSYLVKPPGVREEFVESICKYWLRTNVCAPR